VLGGRSTDARGIANELGWVQVQSTSLICRQCSADLKLNVKSTMIDTDLTTTTCVGENKCVGHIDSLIGRGAAAREEWLRVAAARGSLRKLSGAANRVMGVPRR